MTLSEKIHHTPTNAVLYARAPSNAELLLFDKFVITPKAHNIEAEVDPYPTVPADTDRLFGVKEKDRAIIEYLGEHDVVYDVRPSTGIPLPWPNARTGPTPHPDTLDQMNDFALELWRRRIPDTMTAFPENVGALTVRLWALIMQHLSQESSTQALHSFFPVYDQYCPVLQPTSMATPVVSVILRALPIPAQDVPTEAILDFRRDEDAMDTLKGLRIWANDIGRKDLSSTEIQQKLEELLFEHQQHMKLHKLEARNMAFRTILRLPFEIAENIPRLKFTKIFDSLCNFRLGRLDLLKAEKASPGRRVAYVTRIAERFGGYDSLLPNQANSADAKSRAADY